MSNKSFPAPRPSQALILEYEKGRMGVSAVPGSGKTWTLSLLAARLVRDMKLERGQQILVVTLVNAARGKFEQQVRDFLGEESLGTQYRVRTLHGLAKDIVSERPGLVGLADDFQVIADEEAQDIIRDALQAWFNSHPEAGQEEYLAPEHREKDYSIKKWRNEAVDIVSDFIKRAKDFRKGPESLRHALSDYPQLLPLAEMCVYIYEAYERGLRYRGMVDFQDLIRFALQALESDEEFRVQLSHRWPVILEDEAQDSSHLQEEILRALTGDGGNWVRVGDPNQAIYETFTTASPEYLRGFLLESGVTARELPESGRSAPSIITLANRLIGWSLEHPNSRIRDQRPLAPPLMRPLAEGNPADQPGNIRIHTELKLTSDEERNFVARSLREWLPKHKESTVVVLVPTNSAGAEMSKILREYELPFLERLRTTTSTRQVAGTLYRVGNFLVNSTESGSLADAFLAWRRDDRDSPLVRELYAHLKRIKQVEQFTSPHDRDWLHELEGEARPEAGLEMLREFRTIVQRWERSTLLPIDQMILTLAGDLFTAPAEIATASSIALHLQRMEQSATEIGLDNFVEELKAIALNNRKFIGLGEDDDQFDPSRYPGQVVIMTHHGAKGLEWDRVHLMSVNNYDFPSDDPQDLFQGEPFFARDSLNLRAEGLAQLKSLIDKEPYLEGNATAAARTEYSAERLRLLYVGITRAKRELIVTWNTGRKGTQTPARPLHSLAHLISNGSGGV